MGDKMKINELKEFFKGKPFTNDELYNYYSHDEPDLKRTTFRWRIYNLKNQGVIYSPKRGLYVTTSKNDFTPIIDKELSILYKKYHEFVR